MSSLTYIHQYPITTTNNTGLSPQYNQTFSNVDWHTGIFSRVTMIAIQSPKDITLEILGMNPLTKKKFFIKEGSVKVSQDFVHTSMGTVDIASMKSLLEDVEPLVYESANKFFKKIRKEFLPVETSRAHMVAMIDKNHLIICIEYMVNMSPTILLDIKHVKHELLPTYRVSTKSIVVDPETFKCTLE